jgi:hypothetical protein
MSGKCRIVEHLTEVGQCKELLPNKANLNKVECALDPNNKSERILKNCVNESKYYDNTDDKSICKCSNGNMPTISVATRTRQGTNNYTVTCPV